MASSEAIDALLARYLVLLDEYTRLRASLSARQAAMYGFIARANFAAERGFRYGPDHFDDRMQASARVSISLKGSDTAKEDGRENAQKPGSEDVALFHIVRAAKKVPKEESHSQDSRQESHSQDSRQESHSQESRQESHSQDSRQKKEKKGKRKPPPSPPQDPLQWFGVLTPMALRQAQKEAVEAMDHLIPRLATLSAEMAAVEIEVRRARKKRVRAAAAAAAEDEKAQECNRKQDKGGPTTTGEAVAAK